MDPDSRTRWSLLQDIQSIASKIYQDLDDNPQLKPNPHRHTPSVSIPDLILPPHQDILTPVFQLPLDKDTLDSLTKILNQRISQLQQLYLSSYRHSCLNIPRDTVRNSVGHIHQLYQNMTQTHYLPTIRSFVTFIENEVAKNQLHVGQPSRQSFKHGFTPVLEKYFEYNWYPSPLHQSILAEKSGMTQRQISVWFQNHRRRSREDGKAVRRLESDISIKQALEFLPQKQSARRYRPSSTSPLVDNKKNSQVANNSQKLDNVKTTSVLESDYRPPHAYPTPWSLNHHDPFPNDNGIFKFPEPVWRRKPVSTPIIPTAVDVDDFARQFHLRLNFVNARKGENTSAASDSSSFAPWFAPSRTIPPSAPLTALQTPRKSDQALTSSLASLIATDPVTFHFPKPDELPHAGKPNITCIVRLPFGPQRSVSSISERIDSCVASVNQENQGFRLCRRVINSARLPTSRVLSPNESVGRKGSSISRRMPSSLRTFGSRTSSFSSDASSSSDDSSSPSTPPLPNHSLSADPVVETDDFATNFDSFFEVPSSPSFDSTFAKSLSDTQMSSSKSFDFTFRSRMNSTAQTISSRTFDFTFSNSVAQNHTPLIFT